KFCQNHSIFALFFPCFFLNSRSAQVPENSGIFLQQWEAQVRPYIEMIDFMRRIGIEKELALPSIAVVGDQSSGKSSVLEALSGVALPRGSGIVTRCPLELKLRKLINGSGWTAIISYNEVRETFHDPAQVESYVRRAQNMLAGDGVGICDDLISLEITSPDVCDLTLIDLPGITRVPVKGQPEDIGDQIRRLILKFTSKKETINLVVVPCNVDIATTEALRMAQGVDPDGLRTLAILTKPDLIDKGAEADILQVLQGKVVPLKKGYTIVRCRGQSDINENVSLVEATRQEKEFFAKHTQFSYLLEEQRATIPCLSTRLTKELVEHIKSSLPSLRDQIHIHLSAVRVELKNYADGPPLEPERMGPYLSKKILEFSDQISELCRTGESDTGNLYSYLRPVFKQWECHLSSSKSSTKEISKLKNKSGRELLGFSKYIMFEGDLQVLAHLNCYKFVAVCLLNYVFFSQEIILEQFTAVVYQCFQNDPVLQNITLYKIDNIQSSQQAKAEVRISEQFEKKNMIYTQDPIYLKFLNEISDEKFLEDELPIVVQRMSDQLPMRISFFILLDGANVSVLLFENSNVSRRRKDLQACLDRLTAAQEALSDFI
uniref:Si:dkeyp-110c12.3 n=1 Tax=Sinocyclocheilus anshuiensis TaxID=1608454 RepID=A0A671MUU4_9TELE